MRAVRSFVYKPRRKRRGYPKKRTCLMCESDFMATTEFNRICKTCKSTSIWQTGNTTYAMPARNRRKEK